MAAVNLPVSGNPARSPQSGPQPSKAEKHASTRRYTLRADLLTTTTER